MQGGDENEDWMMRPLKRQHYGIGSLALLAILYSLSGQSPAPYDAAFFAIILVPLLVPQRWLWAGLTFSGLALAGQGALPHAAYKGDPLVSALAVVAGAALILAAVAAYRKWGRTPEQDGERRRP